MHFTRGDIGLREPRARYDLDPEQVQGIALHWPGITSPLRTPRQVFDALRSWQAYHMDGRGWSDIAYQVAVDQRGDSYVLRGHRHRSGANGDDDVNRRYGAMLLIVAQGEQPTEAMIDTVRRQIARHRHLFPDSTEIVGHRDVRPEPTACPGDLVERLIKRGSFEPRRPTPTEQPTEHKETTP